jgi:hypothetical protein
MRGTMNWISNKISKIRTTTWSPHGPASRQRTHARITERNLTCCACWYEREFRRHPIWRCDWVLSNAMEKEEESKQKKTVEEEGEI